jgi:hypothetical protein
MASSYTLTEIKTMTDMYTDNPCLEVVGKLSVLLNKPRRSIISKLVKEGVYIRRGYTTKYGKTPVTKLQVVREIEDALDTLLPGLDKAPKTTLHALCKSILEVDNTLETTLEELAIASGAAIATKDMLAAKDRRQPIEIILGDDS